MCFAFLGVIFLGTLVFYFFFSSSLVGGFFLYLFINLSRSTSEDPQKSSLMREGDMYHHIMGAYMFLVDSAPSFLVKIVPKIPNIN